MTETGGQLHAYALITNHGHFLVTPHRAATVPKLIISLGRRYAQYINTSCRRTGTLWDSRYKSSLIQAETYLLTCMRYIELNPVRATMVEDPRIIVGQAIEPTPSGKRRRCLSLTRLTFRLVRPTKHGKPPTVTYSGIISTKKWSANCDWRSNQNQPLGNERFYEMIERMAGQRRKARPRGRPRFSGNVTNEDVKGQGDLGL